MSVMFEPPKKMEYGLYKCGPKFRLEPLYQLMERVDTFAVVVVDGNGITIGTIESPDGRNKKVLQNVSVTLPNSHRRGGQSAARFGRIRQSKRDAYVRKCAELINDTLGGRDDVSGIIFAGSADFKHKLFTSEDVHVPIREKFFDELIVVDVGGVGGFRKAVESAVEMIERHGHDEERKMIGLFNAEVAKDSGKYCFGEGDVKFALEIGAVKHLLVGGGDNDNNELGKDVPTTRVTDKTEEGVEFIDGYGIGAILLYRVDPAAFPSAR